MSHVYVGIGNTDNKLTQQEWSAFVGDVGDGLTDLVPRHPVAGCSGRLPTREVFSKRRAKARRKRVEALNNQDWALGTS